ncbi:hypothetical protein QTP70_010444 [Hemibagrus guttatus]|uniref:Uncharacterized protein n=1 Tax=Hemibagrus guttatus TaxID=175788 RepID=A0AAE0QKH3_9TELE|nr:hypothetical protein QTP70_010444 [Hemibagrus guttatus]
MRTAEKIIRVSLPSITDIYTTGCIRKDNSIVDDPTHLTLTFHPAAIWKKVQKSYTSHSRAPSILSFQCDHWLYPWSESCHLVVLTDAVDGSVWTACVQETAVERATWGL